eukprot:3533256-Alexandrium_andersonii.AAC.1
MRESALHSGAPRQGLGSTRCGHAEGLHDRRRCALREARKREVHRSSQSKSGAPRPPPERYSGRATTR